MSRRAKATFAISAALAAIALPGCTVRQASTGATDAMARASAARLDSRQPLRAREGGVVQVSDGLWLGGRSVRSENGEPLPARFEGSRSEIVTIGTARPVSLKEAASEVGSTVGLPVVVEDDTESLGGQAGGAAATTQTTMAGLPPLPGTLGSAFSVLGTPTGQGVAQGPTHRIEERGTLRQVLDRIAARYGVAWEFRGGSIRFLRTITQTFILRALPASSSFQAGVGGQLQSGSGGGSSGGSGGGSGSSGGIDVTSQQSASSAATIEIWKEVEATVKSMLPGGSKSSFSPTTGTVTVTTSPSVMRRVSDFMSRQNRQLSLMVAFNVQVYSVTLSDGDQYGIDWEKVANTLTTHGVGVNFNGPSSGVSTGGLVNFTLNGGNFAGSNAMIRALSTQGKVSVESNASNTTLNNVPVPVQIGTQFGYVARAGSTTTNFGSTSTIEPGQVNTGLSLTVLPRVLDDNQIMMQLAIGLSDLKALRDFSAGSFSVQLPEVDKRTFLQQVMVRSGDTIALAGFEQQRNTVNRNGMLSPFNILTGGGATGQRERTVIVVLLSPVAIDSARQ